MLEILNVLRGPLNGPNEYKRGYINGRILAREMIEHPIWAEDHTIRYDDFDRGWDDGVRAALELRKRIENYGQ